MDFSDMRAYFEAGRTLDPAARIESLRALEAAIRASEGEICQALQADLGKAPLEAYMTEIGMVLEELRYQIRHVRAFSRPRRVRTPLMHFPAVSRVYPEPYGLVLVMAPWNYPFQLSLEPLIGALAAGNCVVLKPSNYAPHTARAMEALLTRALPRELVRVVQGGRKENAALLDTRFDSIFFTGGRTVGRLVMEKAAQFLTPVTLELGGKSPVLVLARAPRSRAAQREVLGSLAVGGGCVNDTIIHLATTEMGFGGVGASGMGAYHGRKSFDTFSHEKSVVHRGAFPDVDARYHPYTEKKEKLVRSLLH